MKLECKPLLEGIMAYWEETQEAASYTAVLYINDTIISRRTIQRGELYCSFKGLAAVDGQTRSTIRSAAVSTVPVVGRYGVKSTHSGKDYYVQILAENRNGEIIDASDKVKCAVKEF